MEAVEDYLVLAEQQVAKGRMSPAHHFNFVEELFLVSRTRRAAKNSVLCPVN
jgi:hypothetical protein